MPLVSSWDDDPAICCIKGDCSLWNMEVLCDTEGFPEDIFSSFLSWGDLLFSLHLMRALKGDQGMSKANLESQFLH